MRHPRRSHGCCQACSRSVWRAVTRFTAPRKVPDEAVWAPPGTLLANPVPGGHPPFAPAWVIGHEVYVDADEAAAACEKFLGLAERLVMEFQ